MKRYSLRLMSLLGALLLMGGVASAQILTVTETTPANGAVGIDANFPDGTAGYITVGFSESIAAYGDVTVVGSLSGSHNTDFTGYSDLNFGILNIVQTGAELMSSEWGFTPGETVTVTLTGPWVGISGGSLTVPYEFSFTVAEAAPSFGVVGTAPTDGATGVTGEESSPPGILAVQFDEDIDQIGGVSVVGSIAGSYSADAFKASDYVGDPDVAGISSGGLVGFSFSPGEVVTVTLTGTWTGVSGGTLEVPYEFSFTMAGEAITPLTVTLTGPADGATDVAFVEADGDGMGIEFGETMSQLGSVSVTGSSSGPFAVNVVDPQDPSYPGLIAFLPQTGYYDFTPGETVTVTLTGTWTGTSGATLPVPYSFSFTMAEAVTPLTVVSTTPAENATDVSANLDTIRIAFNGGFTGLGGVDITGDQSGTVGYGASQPASKDTLIIDLAPHTFTPGEIVTVTLTGTLTGVSGGTLATPYSFSFTIAGAAPTVSLLTYPANGAIDVSPALTAITFEWDYIFQTVGTVSVVGDVNGSYDIVSDGENESGGTIFTSDFSAFNFAPGEHVTVTLDGTWTGDGGENLLTPYTFSFTVAEETTTGPLAWTYGESMQTERYAPGAAVANGALYAVGGASFGGIVNSVERYDIATDTWTPVAALPEGASSALFTAAAVGDSIYATAGNNLFIYSISGNSWITGPSLPVQQAANVSAVALGGRVYFIGGSISANLVQVYNPADGSWSNAPSLPGGVSYAPVATDGQHIYVAEYTNLYIFDPTANEGAGAWDTGPTLPNTVGGKAAAFVDGKFLIIGGTPDSESALTTVYAYDTATGQWESGPDLNTARFYAGAGVVAGKVVAFGGVDASIGLLTSVEILDVTDGGGTGGDALYLPEITEVKAGSSVAIPVTGTMTGAYNLDMAFSFDPSVVMPTEEPVVSSAFSAKSSNVMVDWNVVGDTIYVAIASSEPISVSDSTVVSLAFTAVGEGTSALTWLASTAISEVQPMLTDGSVSVSALVYGDVTQDGNVSALDAAHILQYVVKKITDILMIEGDVTDNGTVSGYDAALVLYKVVNPSYLFPVEGGAPPRKASRGDAVTLSWESTANGWVLTSNIVDGPVGADLTLRMHEGATLSSDGIMVSDRNGDLVTVSLASTVANGALLSIEGMSSTPEIVTASVNEQLVTMQKPLAFELAQNAPNPFNPSTTIRFTVPQSGPVSMVVFDVNGRMVRTLVNGAMPAGAHEVVWDGMDNAGRAVASGVYVYRIRTSDNVASQRMTLVR